MSTTTALVTISESDQAKVRQWLHNRPETTVRAYEREAWQMLTFIGKPLERITLADLQQYQDELASRGLSLSSQARAVSAIKSLLTFLHRAGLIPANVGAAVRTRAHPDNLTQRILSETAVQKMLAREDGQRDHALLRLMYAAGLRASELARLCWRDVQERRDKEAGQVTRFGKGGKTISILVSPETWRVLEALRASETLLGYGLPDSPVFRSRKHAGHLTTTQVYRIVRAAAKAAGLDAQVSPHWLRHAHASHALDRGAPISLVQATLGHASVQTTGRYLHARPDASSGQYLPV